MMKRAWAVMTANGHNCGVFYGTTEEEALLAWALDTGYCTLAAALEINPGMWAK